MTPIDKHQPVPPRDRKAKLPDPGDDRLNQDLVEDGLNEAENELRQAVEREEEDRALESPNAEENLDDVRHPGASPDAGRPAELDAIEHRDAP